MIDDLSFNNIQGINLNTPLIDSDLLDGITASFENSYFEPQVTISAGYGPLDCLNSMSEFKDNMLDVEDNPIVKDVFNSIRGNHNIDLSRDPIVVETLKSLLYL